MAKKAKRDGRTCGQADRLQKWFLVLHFAAKKELQNSEYDLCTDVRWMVDGRGILHCLSVQITGYSINKKIAKQ